MSNQSTVLIVDRWEKAEHMKLAYIWHFKNGFQNSLKSYFESWCVFFTQLFLNHERKNLMYNTCWIFKKAQFI